VDSKGGLFGEVGPKLRRSTVKEKGDSKNMREKVEKFLGMSYK